LQWKDQPALYSSLPGQADALAELAGYNFAHVHKTAFAREAK
jgi:hypothetical protein